MSQYFNTQCGAAGDWKILEGTYTAPVTGTPGTLYLNTATGTWTGYAQNSAAFPVGGGVAGAGLTPAQAALLASAVQTEVDPTALKKAGLIADLVYIPGASTSTTGNLVATTVTKAQLEGFDARITTAQTAATTSQTATQTPSSAIAADATHVAVPSVTTQGAIDDLSKAIKAIPGSIPTTNTLAAATSAITSTVNGIAATITPATGTIASTLGFDATGNLVKQVASASGVTNVSSSTADLTVATGTSTPVLTIVSAPKLTTPRTINGVAFDGTANITIVDATKVASITSGIGISNTGTATAPIINNTGLLSIVASTGTTGLTLTPTTAGGAVTQALTGTLATANGGTGLTTIGTAGQVLTSNGTTLSFVTPTVATTTNTLGSAVNTITSTVNGVAATASAVNTVANASTINTLTTTVNGVAGTGVSIVNTNVLAVTAGALTSTINGVASNALTLPKSSYNLSYGYSIGNNTTGDQDLTEEIFTINNTITNAVLIVKAGTFPATATTLRIKAGATDYATITVPANQGVTTGTSLPCTITTALINGTPTAPIQTVLSTSQAVPNASFKIVTTNQN